MRKFTRGTVFSVSGLKIAARKDVDTNHTICLLCTCRAYETYRHQPFIYPWVTFHVVFSYRPAVETSLRCTCQGCPCVCLCICL